MKTGKTGFQTRHSVAGILVTLLVGALVLALSSPALATQVGRIAITSSPPGARIFVGPQVVGVTPTTISLPADGKSVQVKLSKRGYRAKMLSLRPKAGKTQHISVRLQKR